MQSSNITSCVYHLENFTGQKSWQGREKKAASSKPKNTLADTTHEEHIIISDANQDNFLTAFEYLNMSQVILWVHSSAHGQKVLDPTFCR